MDGGSRNLDLIAVFIEYYKIHGAIISPYYLQGQVLVERNHESIINGVAKYSKQTFGDWIQHLPLALWVD